MSLINGTSENFESEVISSEKPVLVDFNAGWCGPCKMLAPIIDEIANTRDDIKVVSVDVDEEDTIAEEYGVMSIPCLVVFKNGKEVTRSVGFKSKEDIESMLGGE